MDYHDKQKIEAAQSLLVEKYRLIDQTADWNMVSESEYAPNELQKGLPWQAEERSSTEFTCGEISPNWSDRWLKHGL